MSKGIQYKIVSLYGDDAANEWMFNELGVLGWDLYVFDWPNKKAVFVNSINKLYSAKAEAADMQ